MNLDPTAEQLKRARDLLGSFNLYEKLADSVFVFYECVKYTTRERGYIGRDVVVDFNRRVAEVLNNKNMNIDMTLTF